MKRTSVIRAFVVVSVAVVVAAYAEGDSAKSKSRTTVKSWSCSAECGFSISSRDETEAVDMVEQHQRKVHQTYLTDEDTRAQLKVEVVPVKT